MRISAGWTRLNGAVMDAIHEVHFGAQTHWVTRAVGAAEAGSLCQHVLDACLLPRCQRHAKANLRPSAMDFLRRREEVPGGQTHSAPQLRRRKARQRSRRISF